MSATQTLSAAWPMGARLNEAGHAEVGGCDLVELAREFGTPAFVVSEDDLRYRARAYVGTTKVRQPDSEVIFASKAFPCTAVARVFAEEGLGCDVASGGELHLALAGGFEPHKVYVHGNAKSLAELSAALDASVHRIIIDGLNEIDRLVSVLDGRTQKVLVRVRPGVKPSTHDFISTGQVDSKFGLALENAPNAIERVQVADGLELEGLHMHIGSQIFELESYRRAVEAISVLGDFSEYDLGGGLGVAYTAADEPPTIETWVETVAGAADEFLGAGKRLIFEPGRALTANSTVTIYSVETVKRAASTYVAVDGGMSDNLRPMLYGAVYEAAFADRPLAPGGERVHVAGKHCESGDIIIRDAELPDPKAGDVLVTPATGAYGYAMANNYNGVLRPPVIFCKDGDARVVVRRETLDDLTSRDV